MFMYSYCYVCYILGNFLHCIVLCIVCVLMCTVLYCTVLYCATVNVVTPIAVNKYISFMQLYY